MHIRPCTPADAEAILRIYAPYVEQTAITMEWVVPSLEAFRRRMDPPPAPPKEGSASLPYLVAEEDGQLLGYAYASPYKTRRGLAHSVETSIYVSADERRQGIGAALYAALEERLAAQGITRLYASITHTDDTSDPYLTPASERFHERMGYTRCGMFHGCCQKFGRTYDLVWMEKALS